MPRFPFTFNEKKAGESLLLQFKGDMDESAELPDVDKSFKKIYVNLGKVTALNSIGTRTWCQWLAQIKAPQMVLLEECPVVIVKSFNMVKGFLTQNAEVISFYIPFYSEETGERTDVLMLKGKHFFPDRVELPEVKDSSGNKMELDIIPATYLAFIKS